VTICAVLRVEFLALRAELRINRKRIFGRFLVEQPLFDARHLFQIDRRRKRAGTECGAFVALLHHAVVAVPVCVDVFFFAPALQPDRGQITEADQLAGFQFFERKFQERFRWVEGVGAARACVRFPIAEAEMAFQREQSFAHERNGVIAQDESIDQIIFGTDSLHLGKR